MKVIKNILFKENKKKGRQLRRWKNDVRRTAGTTWTRKTGNREEWKNLEEAYDLGQTEDWINEIKYQHEL